MAFVFFAADYKLGEALAPSSAFARNLAFGVHCIEGGRRVRMFESDIQIGNPEIERGGFVHE